MKYIKLFLILIVATFSLAASCEADDQPAVVENQQCDCTKTYYLYYPPMGSGNSYVPGHYESEGVDVGKFNCEDETDTFTSVNGDGYHFYKLKCD